MKITVLRQIGLIISLCNLLALTKSDVTEDEDAYVQHFGNYPYNFFGWKTVTSWYKELGEKRLKKYSTDIHKAAGYGEAIVDTVVLDSHRLIFSNANYKSREINVLTYGINGSLWYVTEGVREDCVFYVDLVNLDKRNVKLQKEVCGIETLEVSVPYRRPIIDFGPDY